MLSTRAAEETFQPAEPGAAGAPGSNKTIDLAVAVRVCFHLEEK